MCVVQTSSHQKILSKTSCHKNTRCPNILSDRKKTLPETSCHSNICCPTVVFLEAFGRLYCLYCQHLPLLEAQTSRPSKRLKPFATRRAKKHLKYLGGEPWSRSPRGPYLLPLDPEIASIFPLSWPRGPRAIEPNLPLPGLGSTLSWALGRLYCHHLPPILAQGPPRDRAKPALPGLIRLSWVFLALGRPYCQHLPPILAQGPPRNGAKALTRAYPPILGLS